jgi:hypothetical protein
MNLVPGDMNNQWYKIDEVNKRCGSSSSTLYFKSDFEKERIMLVLAAPTSSERPAKILLFDLDNQSKSFGQVGYLLNDLFRIN